MIVFVEHFPVALHQSPVYSPCIDTAYCSSDIRSILALLYVSLPVISLHLLSFLYLAHIDVVATANYQTILKLLQYRHPTSYYWVFFSCAL